MLSLGTDLGLGQPMEHMIRACLIALRLGEQLGLAESERGVVYYSGLLAWVGCHTDAYEQAKWLGNDITQKSDAHYHHDLGGSGRRCRSCSSTRRIAAGSSEPHRPKSGSNIEMIWIRESTHDPRGRIFGTLFKLVGKLIFAREAKRSIRNLEGLEVTTARLSRADSLHPELVERVLVGLEASDIGDPPVA